jgi:REP element-mobilizing transposase RayT
MGHPPRIPVWLPLNQTVIYFITLCVRDRKKVLANDVVFRAFQESAKNLKNWIMLAASLMPDHLHLLAAPKSRDLSAGNLSAGIRKRCDDL